MTFWVLVQCNKPLPLQVWCPFGVHKFSVFVFILSWDYIWSQDQVIMRLCISWPNTISHYLVEFGSHDRGKSKDITFFIRHVTIVSCDHCRGWSLLISHHHFKFSRICSHGSWSITFSICHVTTRDHVNETTCDS